MEQTIELKTSFAQESLWLQHQLDPDQPTYHVVPVVRIRGPLDATALESALGTVVERHEALRTVFALVDGAPVQVIGPGEPVTVRVVDVEPGEVDAAVQEEVRRPFDLRNGPLLRCTLLRLAADHHVVVLAMHHIVTDGVSSRILFSELSAAYEAHSAGREPLLPELSIQYADFAVWQRDRLQGETLRGLTEYWGERLAGARALCLPTDRPRPEVPTSRGRSHWFTLPGPLMDRLERLARNRQSTLFMVLLAGFDVLLSRYCRQDDVTVASPTAGRGRPELEGLIGYFVNTLPLRVDLGGDPSFGELIDRVRDTCVGAWDHQEVPFALLLERLRAERHSAAGTADAPVMMILQNMERPSWSTAGLEFEPMWKETGTAKTDLLLDISPGAEAYRARFEYSTELFDEDTVVRMASHLETLLHSVADAPHRRISGIPLLTADERAATLAVGGRTDGRTEPVAAHVPAEDRARRTPDAPALLSEDEQVGYGELDSRATSLAARLRTCGVGTETTVALILDATPELLVALLAVSKAGGGHLVLDPKDPAEVLCRAIAESGATHAVTHGAQPPLPDAVTVVALDTPGQDGESAPGGTRTPPPGSLAATAPDIGHGARSGPLHSHGQLTAGARASAEALGLVPGDRYVVLSPGPAQLAAEAWPVLAAGAALVLPGTWAAAEKAEATVVSFSGVRPGEGRPAARPASVHTEIFWDDGVPTAEELGEWARTPGRLLHVRAVPEVAGLCTVRPLTHGEVVHRPLGRPAPGLRAHVLDARLEPVPLGTTGELHLAGPAVSRGYRARPGETAARFVPDPHGSRPGGLLHRTGELVRQRPDGGLEFVGRADGLVNSGGLRVTPSAIEEAAATHPDVADCAVVALPDPAGGRRLVLYVAPRPGTTVDPGATTAYLYERLPKALVPRMIVPLERLPRTATGALSHSELPAPDAQPGGQEGYVAPRTPFEEEIAGIWQELLDVELVGVHDDFFELGGQSLAAVGLAARVRDIFGVDLPLRELYANFTVAEMAWQVLEALTGPDPDGGKF
ncbi:condensation domain-containing protein [Streptomyces albicerus]|uniref:condensation domain-containing protein n=1 Tax=Streptomyces albicerus TaxID=2569859 RepID=UPI001788D32F|nr:condensation domain-containing protein [Streptomyces albicerus]